MTKNLEKWFWPIVVSISVLAACTSLFLGMAQSVWFDEAYSIMVAKQSVSQVIYLVSVDTHPPLYYVLLHWWGELWNWNIFSLRFLSIVAYGGSLLIAVLLAKRLFGKFAGIWTALVLAFAPLLMRYGFEIRMYSIASLLGISATYLLVLAWQQKGSRRFLYWAVYGVLVVAGMYTLYYLALLWVAHAAWLLYMTYQNKQLVTLHKQPWLWAYAASIVPFLPWLPMFLKQVNNGALAPIGQPMNLENAIGVVSFNFMYQPAWGLSVGASLLVVALFIASICLIKHAWNNLKKTEVPYFVLLALYIVVPISLLVLVSFSRSMYVERYLSHIAIGFMTFVGVSIALALRTSNKQTYVAIMTVFISLVVGMTTLAAVGNYNFQRMGKPDVKAAVSEMLPCENSSIIAADPYVYIELSAYVSSSCDLWFYNHWGELGGGYAPLNTVSRQLHVTSIPTRSPVTYYVYYDEPKLTTESFTIVEVHKFGTLSVAKLAQH